MGSHYLSANVRTFEGLKDVGMHNKSSSICTIKKLLHNKGLRPAVKKVSCKRGLADMRSKMRPDMMLVEMTMTEQQQYFRHDDHSDSGVTALAPVIPNENLRSCIGSNQSQLDQVMRASPWPRCFLD